MCYNKVMFKIKTKVIACIVLVFAMLLVDFRQVFAASTNVNFEVNVVDNLSVTITTPDSWASTDTVTSDGVFLRNEVGLSVTTNVPTGFTASMYSRDNTRLVNTAKNTLYIPTLSSSSTRGSFPSNYWGYSLGSVPSGVTGITYGETMAGNNSSYYHPMVATSNAPITLIYKNTSGTGTQDIYFGAKANLNQGAGTYANVVIISVVTGAIDNNTNPITPTNPAVDELANNTPAYNDDNNYGVGNSNASGTTVTTNRSGTTTTTDVVAGDIYGLNQVPHGVTNIAAGSMLAMGLGTAASVAAASGMFFFIVAGRDEGDDDDEEDVI